MGRCGELLCQLLQDLLEAYIQAREQGAFCLASTATLLVGVAAPEVHLLTLQSTLQGDRPGTVVALLRDEDFGPNGKVICHMSSKGLFRLKALCDNYYSLLTDGSLNWKQVSECQVLITALDGGSSGSALAGNISSFPQPQQELFMSKSNVPGICLSPVFARTGPGEE